MVSAAKLKKAQDAITAMRPYANKLTELLQNLSASLDSEAGGQYAEERAVKNVLIVAITSNRGLCGAFNSNIIKHCISLTQTEYEGASIEIMSVGKKGNDLLSKTFTMAGDHHEIFDNLTFENTAVIAEDMMEAFTAGTYDKIILVYNRFKNAATQIVTTEQFLPIISAEGDQQSGADYLFEPSQEDIVTELIPKSLKTQLYKAIRDSFASEH